MVGQFCLGGGGGWWMRTRCLDRSVMVLHHPQTHPSLSLPLHPYLDGRINRRPLQVAFQPLVVDAGQVAVAPHEGLGLLLLVRARDRLGCVVGWGGGWGNGGWGVMHGESTSLSVSRPPSTSAAPLSLTFCCHSFTSGRSAYQASSISSASSVDTPQSLERPKGVLP